MERYNFIDYDVFHSVTYILDRSTNTLYKYCKFSFINADEIRNLIADLEEYDEACFGFKHDYIILDDSSVGNYSYDRTYDARY